MINPTLHLAYFGPQDNWWTVFARPTISALAPIGDILENEGGSVLGLPEKRPLMLIVDIGTLRFPQVVELIRGAKFVAAKVVLLIPRGLPRELESVVREAGCVHLLPKIRNEGLMTRILRPVIAQLVADK